MVQQVAEQVDTTEQVSRRRGVSLRQASPFLGAVAYGGKASAERRHNFLIASDPILSLAKFPLHVSTSNLCTTVTYLATCNNR